MTRCPVCCQELPHDLHVGNNLVASNGVAVWVSAVQSRLLKLLQQKYPDMATHDEIADQIWGIGEGPKDINLQVGQHIFRLRQKLPESEYWIKNHRGRGYALVKTGVSTRLPREETNG